jgi:hypothetical protein
VIQQIKNCQINLNNCRGAVSVQLLEYFFAQNNLYLISEGYEISLVEYLPDLIRQNQENEFVSILLIHDLLKIIKNLYWQQKAVDKSL